MTWEPFYSPVAVVEPQAVRFKALAEVEALLGQTEMAQLEVIAAPLQTPLAVPVMQAWVGLEGRQAAVRAETDWNLQRPVAAAVVAEITLERAALAVFTAVAVAAERLPAKVPTASLSSFIRSECASVSPMKMILLSILGALLACLSLSAQTNFPVRGVVVYPATNAVPNITPPPITVTNHVAAAPFTSGTLTLAWSNPYVGSNWVTVLKGSPVLGIPRSQWPMIWEGYAVSNGRATLTITNPTEFVTANNQIGF